jgi:uncharacterized protein (TIGR02246 family)
LSNASIVPFSRARRSSVLLFALFAGGLAHSVFAQDSAEAVVRRLNAEEVQAFVQKDAMAMARLWSDDFVVTNPLNKFVNKKQVLGMVESGFLVIPSYDRQIEYVRVYGDTVIVAGSETVLWGGRMPNAGKTEHLRFTGVWMKQQGRWQQVARHANIVPPA